MTETVEFSAARVTPAPRTAPLSHEQEQLWLLHRLAPDLPLDNECVAVTLHGPLDAGLLRESLAAVTARHEIWRTVVGTEDGRPVQLVGGGSGYEWSAADFSKLAPAEREAESLHHAGKLLRRPFDLATGPLLRVALIRLDTGRHRLFAVWHRVACDRASVTGVLLPELHELYDARLADRAGELPPVDQQYSDHAARQRAGQPGGQPDGPGLRFWREYLAGAPTLLELPADHRRPGRQSYRGAVYPFGLGAGLTGALRELAGREQVTPRTVLAAAFSALLQRYTGQDDLLLGVSVPGRAPGQRAMGLYTRTTVLRADLSGQPSTQDLLRRAHAASEAARGHAEVPLDAIVQEVQPERSLACHPLVQVLLAFEPEPPAMPAGWQLTTPGIHTDTAKFDLCLELDERPDELTGRFIYSSDLFDPGTIARLAGHWRTLLAAMVAQPSRPVRQLPMLTGPETQQLLSDWSTGPEPPAGPDIVTLIGEQARIRPDDIAVSCGSEQLSYRQLTERAGRLARHLRERGAGPEVPVGVCLDRSLGQVTALLAILRAGAAYVTLDPDAPAERSELVIRDTQMPLLITQERLRPALPVTDAQLVSLDGDHALIEQQSAGEPPGEPSAGQLAYIIYTSGSTGRPKGVMVERGALSAHMRAMIAEYRLGPGDRVLQFSQYSADASLEQMLPALAAGCHLVVRGSEIWPARQLLAELTAGQVTVMNLSPAHWQQVVREWTETGAALDGLRLRLVILGGERLSPQAVAEWRELGLPRVRLANAYGPTETTITATLGEAGEEHDLITIGRPLAGRSMYILDRAGQPVPVGVFGELHIGGPLLARGYLNQPALTEERFVPDPFAAHPGGRLYRTGDLVRYLPDGRLDCAGRNDEQVKVRGFRIELGEVEAVLAEHPAVAEAVVVAQGDSGDKELVAFVVTRTGEPLPDGELRRYLAAKLPRHMRPAAVEQLAELPRLATGKPDRRRLPRVERATRRDGTPYLPPRTLAEQQLVRIWEELLEPRPIGIQDNFFHLGGHSLLAAQLVDRIERATGQKLALSTLFAGPTVEQLAAALQSGGPAGTSRVRVLPVQGTGSRPPFFFLHGDWTGGAFYCFALARACGPEQPFHVLEPYKFSARDEVPTVEEVAAAHIDAVRQVQPAGPYRLGGFCNGGLLAYEMARQLERDGQQVEFLGLVDPSPPVQASLLSAVCDQVHRLRRGPAARRADLYLWARHAQRHVYRRLRPNGSRVTDFGKLLVIDPRLDRMFPPRDALYADFIGVLTWAAARYRTGIYSGGVTFYWAREEPGIARTWRPVIGRKTAADVEEHPVPGTHMATITDHIEELAAVLADGLARAGQPGGRRAAAAAGTP
ncbi:MAG TPA: amino acid adenylation domain-containing protein [Streptosporangiaceae bacterium]|jgi:amino acid adenylation domain-containing protein